MVGGVGVELGIRSIASLTAKQEGCKVTIRDFRKMGDEIIEKEGMGCGYTKDTILGEWSYNTLALHLF